MLFLHSLPEGHRQAPHYHFTTASGMPRSARSHKSYTHATSEEARTAVPVMRPNAPRGTSR